VEIHTKTFGFQLLFFFSSLLVMYAFVSDKYKSTLGLVLDGGRDIVTDSTEQVVRRRYRSVEGAKDEGR
jgi:hypothetical protein